VGAGPTGLAAAYYLLQKGHACTVFDARDVPGGALRYAVEASQLPRDVLDAEIAVIARLGAAFEMNAKVDGPRLKQLAGEFDAVVLGIGECTPEAAEQLGLAATDKGVRIDAKTFATSIAGVFAGGEAVRRSRQAVRAVADGRGIAESADQYLAGGEVTGPHRPFTVHVGKLKDGEIDAFMAGISDDGRVEPAGDGFADEEARTECARCLHCDCRKPVACKLRLYADEYGARAGRFRADRRTFAQHAQHHDVIYEPGKCIDCGICIKIAAAAGEQLGLTFIGRGFSVRVGVPFNESLAAGLRTVARQCADACPTGALALKDA